MAVHVIGLTVAGGLPILSRKLGHGETPPFSMVASLNGVHMYGVSQSMILKTTATEEAIVVWTEFEESILLIGTASGTSEAVLNQLLASVFRAMVLGVGVSELRNPRNADTLKRELRICAPVIDCLLECVGDFDGTRNQADLLGLSQSVLCTENHLLQGYMDAFSECCDSLYGVLLIDGQASVATPCWWQLEPDERKLLALFATAGGSGGGCAATSRDVPVFLPCKSPGLAFRLVCCVLVTGVEVCLLCGPTPSLSEVEEMAGQCWRDAIDLLKAAQQCHPCTLPPTIQLDTGVMGVLLVDKECGKFVMSRAWSPAHGRDTSAVSSTHRLNVLRTFYYQISSTLFRDARGASQPTLETYWCSEYHKCHALQQGSALICVLYTSAVPTHTMRIQTRDTLKLLTTDKLLSWSGDGAK